MVARCVRRAWLWGFDEYAGRDYSHRKEWVLERLTKLATIRSGHPFASGGMIPGHPGIEMRNGLMADVRQERDAHIGYPPTFDAPRRDSRDQVTPDAHQLLRALAVPGPLHRCLSGDCVEKKQRSSGPAPWSLIFVDRLNSSFRAAHSTRL